MKIFRRIAAACAVAVVLPQMAMASLVDNDIYVEFYADGIYFLKGGAGGPCDDGVTANSIQQDTFGQTVDATSGYTFGSGDIIADCYFDGDALSIVGDTLNLTVGSNVAWGPMTITMSGWEETLLAVNVTLNGLAVPSGADGVSSETLTASSWMANLSYSVNDQITFTFLFDDNTGGPTGEVPLPMSAALLLTGIGGFAATRRRRG